MKDTDIRNRIESLLLINDDTLSASEGLFFGTLNIIEHLYGSNSIQLATFSERVKFLHETYEIEYAARRVFVFSKTVLNNTKQELDSGLLRKIETRITGEVFTDFLQLAKKALEEKTEDGKNVAAVLSAALFEDTMRRLTTTHIEKLADVLTTLKNQGILSGSQVGIANSYLNFRNNALHAQWDKIERSSVSSILGFIEELLTKHFS